MTRDHHDDHAYGWSSKDVCYGQFFYLCDAIQGLISPVVIRTQQFGAGEVVHITGRCIPTRSITIGTPELLCHKHAIALACTQAFDTALDTIPWSEYWEL